MIDKKNAININSTLIIHFNDNKLCEIAYNSFLPEFNKETKRSKISLQLKGNSLIFSIASKDITACRAAINEIISFGKILENTIQLI